MPKNTDDNNLEQAAKSIFLIEQKLKKKGIDFLSKITTYADLSGFMVLTWLDNPRSPDSNGILKKVPKEMRKEIFDDFYRLKTQLNYLMMADWQIIMQALQHERKLARKEHEQSRPQKITAEKTAKKIDTPKITAAKIEPAKITAPKITPVKTSNINIKEQFDKARSDYEIENKSVAEKNDIYSSAIPIPTLKYYQNLVKIEKAIMHSTLAGKDRLPLLKKVQQDRIILTGKFPALKDIFPETRKTEAEHTKKAVEGGILDRDLHRDLYREKTVQKPDQKKIDVKNAETEKTAKKKEADILPKKDNTKAKHKKK